MTTSKYRNLLGEQYIPNLAILTNITSSYDNVETVRALRNTVDVFLPDFKYYREDTALKLSSARNYPSVGMG